METTVSQSVRDRVVKSRYATTTPSWWLSVLMMGMPFIATAQTTEAQRAVLIGASYAEGWGSPSLPGLRVTNKGRSGDRTAQMLARFDADVISAKPDVVIIWGHINDISSAPSSELATAAKQAMLNLEQMIRAAIQARIVVAVATEVTMTEPRGFSNWAASVLGRLLGKTSYQTRVNTQVRAVNDFLRDFAEVNALTLLDLEQALIGPDGERRSEFAEDDGSHINAAGYEALTAFASAQLSHP
jgi:lysophospholipase L1-like esterase